MSGRGRFFTRRCPDPNCDGTLVREEHPLHWRRWRCNGLTHRDDTTPLAACRIWHQDGGDRP